MTRRTGTSASGISSESPKQLFLGVDGGGSHTRVVLADEGGCELARATGTATNPCTVGFDRACLNLRRTVETVLKQDRQGGRKDLDQADIAAAASPFTAAFFAIAGLKTREDKHRFRAYLETEVWAKRFEVGDDAHGAWAGALGGKPGLVILCGTGSKVYGVTAKNRVIEVGGYGYLLGDEGSGTSMGLSALRRVVQAEQGRSQSTLLTRLILEHLQLSAVPDLINWTYSKRRSSRDFAGLFPLVAEAARQGDVTATDIIEDAARELAGLVVAASGHFGRKQSVPVSYQGGVFESGELILRPLRRVLQDRAPNTQLQPPALEPVMGCVLLAMRLSEEEAAGELAIAYH